MRKLGLVLLAILVTSGHCYAGGFTFRKPSPLFNKGEIYTRTSTGDVALGVGSNGQVLSVDSSTATGLKWVTPGSASGTVTNSGALTSNAVIIGAGTTVVQAISVDATAGHALMSTTTSPAFRGLISPDITGGVFGANFGGTGQTVAAKGDLLVGNPAGTGWQKLTVGANGTILSADSNQTLGMSWVTPAAGGGSGTITSSSAGQMAFYTAATTIQGSSLITTDTNSTRLSIGPGTSTVSLDVGGSFRTVPFIDVDASTIAPDATKSNFFIVRLTGQPRTLANIVGGTIGQKIVILVSQDSTGSRKIGIGTGIKLGSDVASYDASTTAGTKDYLGLIYSGVTWDLVSVSKGFR